MPKYLNEASYPIFYGGTTFVPGKPIETLDVINNEAFVFGTVGETYAIVAGVNDSLLIRFNNETVLTTVTLTAGVAQTIDNVVTDINTAYGYTVAYNEGGRLKIVAPKRESDISAVWIENTNGTANATLGLIGHDCNPSGLVAIKAFINSTKLSTFNITTANNKFIFKFNSDDWITVTLTVGAARTAQEIADEINTAYRIATGKFEIVAKAVELITGGGDIVLQLISPVVSNYTSSVFIRTLNNTALTVLGFDSDDKLPLVSNGYPQLTMQEILPLYNPLVSYTLLTFPGAGLTTFYTNAGVTAFEFIRVTGAAVNIFIEDVHNLPPINLAVGEKITIEHKIARINKFIFQSLGAGTITILELNN